MTDERIKSEKDIWWIRRMFREYMKLEDRLIEKEEA